MPEISHIKVCVQRRLLGDDMAVIVSTYDDGPHSHP